MAEISHCSRAFKAERGILQMFFQLKITAFIKTKVFASFLLHNWVRNIANPRRSVDFYSPPPALQSLFHKTSFVSCLKIYHVLVVVTKILPSLAVQSKAFSGWARLLQSTALGTGAASPNQASPAPWQGGRLCSLPWWNHPGLPPRGTAFIASLQFCLKRGVLVSKH